MEARLSRWGVGPRIALAAALSVAVAGVATHWWPAACRFPLVPYVALLAVGLLLLVIGVPLWLAGVKAAMAAYNSDALVTTGVFAWVRHPIYGAWIVFNLPAIALLCNSWPLLSASLAGYVVFKLSIGREDRYLEQRFGQAYRDYRRRVNELVPMPGRKAGA